MKKPQSGAERCYAEMLLRQHPWLRSILEGGEYPAAISYKKPETLLGCSLLFIGLVAVADTLLHPMAFGSGLVSILIVLAGAALLYAGFWCLCFAKRAYVLVTSERVVYQKINLIGRPGKTVSLPRSEIVRARFLKSTVMYRIGRGDGGISIAAKNGRTLLISNLLQGENILGALQ